MNLFSLPHTTAALGLAMIVSGSAIAQSAESMGRAVANLNCVACHKQDIKVVGPAWSQLVMSYRGAGDFVRLAGVMQLGNKGRTRWGSIHCPGDPHLSGSEALHLAELLTGRVPGAITATDSDANLVGNSNAASNKNGAIYEKGLDRQRRAATVTSQNSPGKLATGSNTNTASNSTPASRASGNNAFSNAVAACGSNVQTTRLQDRGHTAPPIQMTFGWELVDGNPISVKQILGFGQTASYDVGPPTNSLIDLLSGALQHCQTKRCDSGLIREHEADIAWLTCIQRIVGDSNQSPKANLSGSANNTLNAEQNVAQIPNCPTILPNSCVSWTEKEMYRWNISNRCNKAIVVTYEDPSDGSGRAQTNTIPVGNSEMVKIQRRPRFGVWDADESRALVQRSALRKVPADTYMKCKQAIPVEYISSGSNQSSQPSLPSSTNKTQTHANTAQVAEKDSARRSHDGVNGVQSTKKGTSRYVSNDATACVEVVPEGFKCSGPWKRFLKNICAYKISVRWRTDGGPWGMEHFAPGRCVPDSEKGTIEYSACSWDPNAGYGPYLTPSCHYN